MNKNKGENMIGGILSGIANLHNSQWNTGMDIYNIVQQQEAKELAKKYRAEDRKNYLKDQKRIRQWQLDDMNIQMQRDDTKIRRTMADMKAGGINPLIAGGGTNAGVPMLPSQNYATQQRPHSDVLNSTIQASPKNTIQFNLDLKRREAEIKNIEAQTEKILKETGLTEEQIQDRKQKREREINILDATEKSIIENIKLSQKQQTQISENIEKIKTEIKDINYNIDFLYPLQQLESYNKIDSIDTQKLLNESIANLNKEKSKTETNSRKWKQLHNTLDALIKIKTITKRSKK